MSCNLIQIVKAIQGTLLPGRTPTRGQVRHLLHFDSETMYADATGKPTSTEGGLSISAARKVFGSASFYATAGGRVVLENTSEAALGLGDFTVEFWVYPTSLDFLDNRPEYSYSIPFHQSASTSSTPGSFQIRYTKTGKIEVGLNYGAAHVQTADGALLAGMWSHIAVTRENGVMKIWLNGKERGSATKELNLNEFGYCRIGWGIYGGNGVGIRGHIDEFRLVKGLAVYSEEFTPATTPFTVPSA